jgi:hypothetical protein
MDKIPVTVPMEKGLLRGNMTVHILLLFCWGICTLIVFGTSAMAFASSRVVTNAS